MDLGSVRDYLADALRNVDGLSNIYQFVPESIVPPCVVIDCGDPFVDNQGSVTDVHFLIRMVTGSNDMPSAQRQLDTWCSVSNPGSVSDALEQATGEGLYSGLVNLVHSYGEVTVNDQRYIGTTMELTVYAP